RSEGPMYCDSATNSLQVSGIGGACYAANFRDTTLNRSTIGSPSIPDTPRATVRAQRPKYIFATQRERSPPTAEQAPVPAAAELHSPPARSRRQPPKAIPSAHV